MNILQKGGNKIRQIHVTAIIPECWFEKYLLYHNGKRFGDTNNNLLIFVNVNGNNIWTTNPKNNGNCPYSFICQWMHDTHSLVCDSCHHNEWVDIYDPIIQYSKQTNELQISAKVTWSVDKGNIWCVM